MCHFRSNAYSFEIFIQNRGYKSDFIHNDTNPIVETSTHFDVNVQPSQIEMFIEGIATIDIEEKEERSISITLETQNTIQEAIKMRL